MSNTLNRNISKGKKYKSSHSTNTKTKPIVVNKETARFSEAFYSIVGAVINREIVYE